MSLWRRRRCAHADHPEPPRVPWPPSTEAQDRGALLILRALNRLNNKLDAVNAGVQQLLRQQGVQTVTLDDLQAKVTAATTVETSAVTLIQGMADQLKTLSAELAAAGQDTAKIDAMAAQLDAASAPLAAAVAANTTPPPAPAA
jgi:hypothetical protein